MKIVKVGKVSLVGEEQLIAKGIAKMRTDANKRAGTHKNWNDEDPYEIDLKGFSAELAWAKYANLYPDFSISPRRGTPDFYYSDGKSGDVKYTAMKQPKLLVKEHKINDPCDLYVLIIGDPIIIEGKKVYIDFEIIGFATKKQVFTSELTKQVYTNKRNYTVELEDMLKEIDLS